MPYSFLGSARSVKNVSLRLSCHISRVIFYTEQTDARRERFACIRERRLRRRLRRQSISDPQNATSGWRAMRVLQQRERERSHAAQVTAQSHTSFCTPHYNNAAAAAAAAAVCLDKGVETARALSVCCFARRRPSSLLHIHA